MSPIIYRLQLLTLPRVWLIFFLIIIMIIRIALLLLLWLDWLPQFLNLISSFIAFFFWLRKTRRSASADSTFRLTDRENQSIISLLSFGFLNGFRNYSVFYFRNNYRLLFVFHGRNSISIADEEEALESFSISLILIRSSVSSIIITSNRNERIPSRWIRIRICWGVEK